MKDVTDRTLTLLIGLAIVVSVVGFGVQSGLLSILGFATTATGQARINVTPLTALNITHNIIDFGNGTVESANTNCTLSSDRTGDILSCFLPSWGNDGPQRGGFDLANIGNTIINITVKATKNGSMKSGSTSFWGVKSQGGLYKYKCKGNGTSKIATFTNVNNKTTRCIDLVPISVDTRGFSVHINITIPKNASGVKNDTLTFTASRACATTC